MVEVNLFTKNNLFYRYFSVNVDIFTKNKTLENDILTTTNVIFDSLKAIRHRYRHRPKSLMPVRDVKMSVTAL